MKKKALPPLFSLMLLFTMCLLLACLSISADLKERGERDKTFTESGGGFNDAEGGDVMIWEAISHHLLTIGR